MGQDIETEEWGYLVLCSSPVVTAFIVAFTTVESSERYYFLILFVMAYAVVIACRRINRGWKRVIGIVIILLAIVNVYNVYYPILKSEEPPKTDAYGVTEYLADHGYELAYTTSDYNFSTLKE